MLQELLDSLWVWNAEPFFVNPFAFTLTNLQLIMVRLFTRASTILANMFHSLTPQVEVIKIKRRSLALWHLHSTPQFHPLHQSLMRHLPWREFARRVPNEAWEGKLKLKKNSELRVPLSLSRGWRHQENALTRTTWNIQSIERDQVGRRRKWSRLSWSRAPFFSTKVQIVELCLFDGYR